MGKRLIVRGRVQGVGYRAAFHAQAQALKLTGWVRNRRDGSVEAHVSGSDAAIEQIVEWARRGPPTAQVSNVTVAETNDVVLADQVFAIHPTE